MAFVEPPAHHFHQVPDLDWVVYLRQKTPETVSRTWICTRSGENSIENIRLPFSAEKIISSNKLSKRHRLKRTSDLQVRGT